MAKKSGLFESLFKKIGLKVYDFNDMDECLRALNDKDPEIRIKALDSIAQKNTIEDIKPVIKIMREDPNFQVQEAAMNALGELKRDEAVDPLMDMLNAPDQWLRVKSAMILGQIGDLRSLDAIKVAYQSVRGEYQATIERLIAKMEIKKEALKEKTAKAAPPPPGPVGPVQEEKEERSTETAQLHVSDLVKASADAGKNYEDLFRFKQEPAPQTKADKLAKKAEEDKLEENLRFQLSRASSSAPDEKVVEYYYKALKNNDAQCERSLCAYLKAPSETLQLQALQALMGLERKPFIVDEMLAALDNSSPKMCWRIIVALCGVQDPRVGRKLLDFLDESDDKIRKYAHNYFLIYKSQEMVDVIVRDFASCDERARITRGALIARMDTDEIKSVLYNLLQDPKQPEKVILAILDKLPPRQEDIVAYSLPVIIRRKEESLIDAAPRFMKNTNNLLLIEYLRHILFSQNELIRGRAALLLGHLMDHSSAPGIAKLLNDPSEYVRLRAGKALLAMKIKEYHKSLFALAKKDPSLRNRLEFIQIIDQLYAEKSLDLFLELLAEESSEIRCLILDSLSKKNWSAEEKEKIAASVQSLFNDEDMRVLFFLIMLLVKMGSKTFNVDKKRLLSVLWTVIKETRNPSKIRREALYAMLYLSKEDTKEVLKSLVKNDSDEEVVVQAAYYLGSFTGKDVEDALLVACRSLNKNLARAAKESLRKVQIKV